MSFLLVQNPGSFPGEIWNWSPYTGSKEIPKKEADHSRMAGGRFNKQGNWHTRLILGSRKRCRFQHPPTRILKAYIETLTGFSHVFSPDGLNNTLLPQGCVLEKGPTMRMGNGGQDILYFPRTREGVRSLWLPGASSQVNWQSCPLHDLLQQLCF